MNPEVVTSFGSPDPNASPLNLVQLVQLLNSLVSTEIKGSYIPYIIQGTQPSVDDQDKAWIELDTGGRPKAIRIFYTGPSGGKWRRIYNGMIGEVRGFTGDPGYTTSGPFDNQGLGIVGGDYDGWHILNGKDGVADLSNQFVVGARMNVNGNAGGWDAAQGWQTYVDATTGLLHAGGAWKTAVLPENIPLPVANDPATPVKFNHYDVSGVTVNHGGKLWGDDVDHGEGNKVPPYPPAGYPGNTAPKPLFAPPPFYALAWITFVGYK